MKKITTNDSKREPQSLNKFSGLCQAANSEPKGKPDILEEEIWCITKVTM